MLVTFFCSSEKSPCTPDLNILFSSERKDEKMSMRHNSFPHSGVEFEEQSLEEINSLLLAMGSQHMGFRSVMKNLLGFCGSLVLILTLKPEIFLRQMILFIIFCDFTVFYNFSMHHRFKEKKSIDSKRNTLHILELENS